MHKRKRLSYQPLIALGLALTISSIIFYLFNLEPFGSNTLLVSDMRQQYFPFLSGFRRKVLEGTSFFYSMDGGLGYNYWANYAYYLASPLNLLLLFFPADRLNTGINILLILKIGLIAGAMTYMLEVIFQKRSALSIAFGLAYALSSFVFAYIIHIMWLDVLVLLPLVVLGLYRLVSYDRPQVYILALAGAIWCNFYMAFLMAKFLILLFPLVYMRFSPSQGPSFAEKAKGLLISFIKFALASILAAGLTGALVIPTAAQLALTGKAGVQAPELFSLASSWPQVLSSFYPESPASIFGQGGINIYAGLAILILVPISLARKDLARPVKFYIFFLLVLTLASMNSNFIYYLWQHSRPGAHFSFRYAFLWIFFLVSLAYDNLIHSDRRMLGPIFLSSLLVLIGRHYLKVNEIPSLGKVGISYILIPLIAILLMALLYFKGRPGWRKLLSLALILVMVADSSTKAYSSLADLNQIETFKSMDETEFEFHQLKDSILLEEEFSRLSFRSNRSTIAFNHGICHGYKSADIFSTMVHQDFVMAMKALGYGTNGLNKIFTAYHPHILDPLFSTSYYITDPISHKPKPLEEIKIGQTENLELYKTDFHLSPAILTEKDLTSLDLDPYDPVANINLVFDRLGGFSETLQVKDQRDLPITRGTNSLSYTTKEDGYYLLSWQGDRAYNQYLDSKHYSTSDHRVLPLTGMTDLGAFQAGDEVRLRVESDYPDLGQIQYKIIKLDQSAYDQALALFKERNMEIIEEQDHLIKGRLRASEAGQVFIALPYDQGWTFRVNGQRVSTKKALGAFISLKVPAGDLVIEGSFVPVGFRIGLLVSLLSLASLLVLTRSAKGKRSG